MIFVNKRGSILLLFSSKKINEVSEFEFDAIFVNPKTKLSLNVVWNAASIFNPAPLKEFKYLWFTEYEEFGIIASFTHGIV
ncbi:hypothetical protein ONA24_06675 [Mycoplasmopsis cynos]|uniref:hypothetical protein n=1 Tax=Mycoplasmopsis cynos TaxID=171284 RepID=UPI0024CCD2C0|nr:hypothetical protein [Mycoplasmopsis cynos]MCU9933461.1 hypothetical protein [Mycoplasmopsis cynos]WAM03361.1 hypothetical protein ONA22_06690 [Mycoplasmopsis cynos]WAM09626.1 hypothetical protein ONA24_06675 [Mycoplasmopsis cynos]